MKPTVNSFSFQVKPYLFYLIFRSMDLDSPKVNEVLRPGFRSSGTVAWPSSLSFACPAAVSHSKNFFVGPILAYFSAAH
jgi:hypothetical protein